MVYEIHEAEFDYSAYIAKYGLGLGEDAGKLSIIIRKLRRSAV